MAQTNYSFTNFTNATAKAYGKNLPISTKASINICNALRGLRAEKALAYLDDVVLLKRAIPYTRFHDGVGHRPGMAAGRYPVKAASHIREIIASAVANAANHGLSEDLVIISLIANKASTPLHQGRQRRRAMKRTHVEVVVQEVEEKKEAKVSKTKAENKSVQDERKKAPVEKTIPKPAKEKQEAEAIAQDTQEEAKVEETPKEVEAQ
jgi:large subunit ribosomal protein L22